jgi:hypothetical protein
VRSFLVVAIGQPTRLSAGGLHDLSLVLRWRHLGARSLRDGFST